MRALHLPGIPSGQAPPFAFPDRPPAASDLTYTATGYPSPHAGPTTSSENTYLIRVLLTGLTRGELTWQEILEPHRFHPHGSAIPGHDVVGIVQEVDPCTTSQTKSSPKFLHGDKIWALLDFDRDGAAAEYAIATESELSLAPKNPTLNVIPDSQWDDQLTTLPLSGLTAYQALFTHGRLPFPMFNTSPSSPPRRVLILGAAGSVGLPALQLAKASSFAVIATASSSSASLITPLLDLPNGDVLLDYTLPSFTSIASSFHSQSIPPVDLVLDCIGASTLTSLLLTTSPPLSTIISPGGKVITIAAPIKAYGPTISSQISSNCAASDVDVDFFIVRPNGAELDVLGRWTEEGKLKGHVHGGKVFGLEEGPRSHGSY